MRVAAESVQLALPVCLALEPADRWAALPEATRAHVLALLARLITRGVLIEEPLVDRIEAGDA
jgi:hypothetical protein